MLVKDLFTEKDGESFCPARLGLLVGLITFICLSFLAVFHGKDFDPQNWGIGYGSLLGGGGAGIWAKGKSE
jgi:hypothetical protein